MTYYIHFMGKNPTYLHKYLPAVVMLPSLVYPIQTLPDLRSGTSDARWNVAESEKSTHIVNYIYRMSQEECSKLRESVP